LINFTVPYSLAECVSRLETTQQVGVSWMPYTRVAFPNTSDSSISFRYEMWIASLKLGYAQGAFIRDGENSTRVTGIAIGNMMIQFAVVVVVMAGLLYFWQRAGGNQNQFGPIAIVFVLVGPGLTFLIRSLIESSLRRVLAS
jgi:hypothetical protein